MQPKFIMYCGSQSVMHIARSLAFDSRTKHTRAQYHLVRGVVQEGKVDMQKLNSHQRQSSRCVDKADQLK